ncbi:thiamine pyrophosphate-binding protein [Flexivirga alba]|uniref:Thiamine pyrophosphate-binding protein n=1 Tax=Flexivirga alba TaxID=702742 RepID=A0ABW2AGC8_9MICO
MSDIAELIVAALADHGVTQVWGVVGDALNPITDAIRRHDGIEWIGVRHEEAAAFAAGAQAQMTGRIGVCMGTVGPGSIHLLNGLYDAKKSHAPVLAICGQVPTPDIGSDFFQEVNNDVLFADVADFAQTITSPGQLPQLLEQAVNIAYAEQESRCSRCPETSARSRSRTTGRRSSPRNPPRWRHRPIRSRPPQMC